MTRPLRVLLLAMLVGCGGYRLPPPDPTLADAEGVAVVAPRSALDAFAASTDPSVRATALAALLRVADADDVEALAGRAAWDPDPLVQEQAALVLLERGDVAALDVLRAFVVGPAGDPYARAHAAHLLLDEGVADGLDPLRTAWAGPIDWRTAPLALVAARLGEDAARAALAEALAAGAVRDDLVFFADLGRFGWPELAADLVRGATYGEEEGSPGRDLARALLGDPAGTTAFRAALRSPDGARDALDAVLALPVALRAAWLREAAASRDAAVRAAAAAWATPTPADVGRALRHPDAYARVHGARAAAVLPVDAARPLLVAALRDDDPDVRATAASSAGALGLSDLGPSLWALAGDDRPEVRVAAYAALLRLGFDVPPAPAG